MKYKLVDDTRLFRLVCFLLGLIFTSDGIIVRVVIELESRAVGRGVRRVRPHPVTRRKGLLKWTSRT